MGLPDRPFERCIVHIIKRLTVVLAGDYRASQVRVNFDQRPRPSALPSRRAIGLMMAIFLVVSLSLFAIPAASVSSFPLYVSLFCGGSDGYNSTIATIGGALVVNGGVVSSSLNVGGSIPISPRGM